MGEVIQFPGVLQVEDETQFFPEAAISCTDCQNVFMGTKGLFCGVFKEMIVFDDIAADCGEFEPF